MIDVTTWLTDLLSLKGDIRNLSLIAAKTAEGKRLVWDGRSKAVVPALGAIPTAFVWR